MAIIIVEDDNQQCRAPQRGFFLGVQADKCTIPPM